MLGIKNKILDYFRSGIVSGRFKPGEVLPYRADIERMFKTTPTTVNVVFQELKLEGFVVARRKAGTKVVPYPPHLYKFAVAFPVMPQPDKIGGEWSYYYESLDRAARQAEQRLNNGISVEPFYGVYWDRASEGYRRLSRAIENNAIAGVFFADHPYALIGTSILMKNGLPRLAFASPKMNAAPVLKDLPSIYASDREFFDKAMSFLAGKGRRKVAVLFLGEMNPDTVDDFKQSAAEHQMTTRPCWYLFAQKGRDYAACIIRLLLDRDQRERPDALIIADDHLVEGALTGAAQSGLDPGMLAIVAYSNFPAVSKVETRITRIYLDSHELLRQAIGLLMDLKARRQVSTVSTVELSFAYDLSPTNRHRALSSP